MPGGLALNLSVYGDVQFSRRLLRVNDRITDMRPAWQLIAEDFYRLEKRQFDSEGGESGGWRPLKPATVAEKAAHGFDHRILHRTLALRESLLSDRHADSVHVETPESVTLGTKVKARGGFPYAAAHQRGTRTVPRRRPIEISPTSRKRWVKIMQRYIVTEGGMQAVGATWTPHAP